MRNSHLHLFSNERILIPNPTIAPHSCDLVIQPLCMIDMSSYSEHVDHALGQTTHMHALAFPLN